MPTNIKGLGWLTGAWRNEEGPMPFEEIWAGPWGGTMAAVSRGLRDGKTAMVELTSIETVADDVVLYLRHFGGGLKPWEGEKSALAWPLVETSENRAVFRNPDRPFPQELVYERRGDTLLATLLGSRDAEETKVVFTLTRVALR